MECINPFRYEGAVTGGQFCGRQDDIEALLQYMTSGNNVIISMKRRVGKTSLIKEIFKNHLQQYNVASGYIDIYSVTSTKELYQSIKEGVVQAVGRSLKYNIAKERITEAFSGAEISATFGASPKINIEFTGSDYGALLKRLLLSLQSYAEKNGIKIALAIDEFQKIAYLEEKDKIEMDLRSAMQDAKNISFVISGSNQTLIDAMFQESRPLYRQGAHYFLKPIDEDVFYEWTKKKFMLKEIHLGKGAFHTIYKLANTEAKIVQHICFELFWRTEALTTIMEENACMVVDGVYRNNSETAAVFGAMKLNAQRMMKVVALEGGINVTVSPLLTEFGMKHGSVSNTLKKLVDDYKITQTDGRYEIVDTELKLWILIQKDVLCDA